MDSKPPAGVLEKDQKVSPKEDVSSTTVQVHVPTGKPTETMSASASASASAAAPTSTATAASAPAPNRSDTVTSASTARKDTTPKQKPSTNKRGYGTRSKGNVVDSSPDLPAAPVVGGVEKLKVDSKGAVAKPRRGRLNLKQSKARREAKQGKSMPVPKVHAHASPPTAQEVQDWFAANALSTTPMSGPVQTRTPAPQDGSSGHNGGVGSTAALPILPSRSNGARSAPTAPTMPPAPAVPKAERKSSVNKPKSGSKGVTTTSGKESKRAMLKRPRQSPQVSFQQAASFYITKKQVPIHVVAAKLQIPKQTLLKYVNGENLQKDHRYIETKVRNFLFQIGDFEKVTKNLKPLEGNVPANRRAQSGTRGRQKAKTKRPAPPQKPAAQRNGVRRAKAGSKPAGAAKQATASLAKTGAAKKNSRSSKSMSDEYKAMSASFMKNWKLRAQGDAKRASSQKHRKTVAATVFDPVSCNEGHKFAAEVNRLCNLFNTNVGKLESSSAYCSVCDAVVQGLENVLNALDMRIAKASNAYEVFAVMKLTEEASVSYTLFNGALSGWHSTLSDDFSCMLLCLWRKVLFTVHAVHPDVYTSSLTVIRLCIWRLGQQVKKGTRFANEAQEHLQVVQKWLKLLERQKT